MSASTAVSVEAASKQDKMCQMIEIVEKQMQDPDALREYLNHLPMTQLTDLLAASESSGAFLGVWDGNPQAEDDNDTTICNCSMTAAAFDMSTRRCSCSTTNTVDTTNRPTPEQSNSMSRMNNAAAQPVSLAPSPSSHPSDLQEIEPIHLNNENDDDGENIDDFKHTLSSLQHLFEDDPNPNNGPPVSLRIEPDASFLDPLQNFLRTKCIEIFVATQHHLGAPGRASKPSCMGQLGLRCIHCKDVPMDELARQAISYPSKRDLILESVRTTYTSRYVH